MDTGADHHSGTGERIVALPGSKRAPLLFSLILVGAVLAPIANNWIARPVDDFPLSYYPMFSARRGETATVTYVLGLDARGRRQLVSYHYAGSGGLNQVRRQLNRIVQRGGAPTLCRQVAARLARKPSGKYADLVTVQIVTGEYHLRDYFTGRNRQPLSEVVHARCPIDRSP